MSHLGTSFHTASCSMSPTRSALITGCEQVAIVTPWEMDIKEMR
jgi:hypothetical protein